MRKFYFLLSLVFVSSFFLANAQTISSTTYPFTTASGATLEDMTSGTTQLVGSAVDDGASIVQPIGFDFWFVGTRYTEFSANSNGLIRLGSTAVTTAFSNNFTTTTNVPQVGPYWDDLATGSNGSVTYKVVGTAPNRKLVIQWNIAIPRSTMSSANATFQCWLNESTGVIDFVYGAGMATGSSYSIGFGSSGTVFASVTTTATSTSSTCAYGTSSNSNTQPITSGTRFSFTPLVPASPTGLTFTTVGATSMTLNWTDNATNEVGYAIYRSLDGITYNYVGLTAANTTSSVQTGLSISTLYYWRVVAVTEGATSGNLDGSQATTACSPIAAATYSVGPTGTYPTLTAAMLAMSNGTAGPVVFELQSTYTSASESFPIVLGQSSCAQAGTVTIRPEAGATALSVIGNNPFGIINIDGGDNYILDGRPGGVGSTSELTIENINANAYTIQYINNATSNIIRYATIRGANASSTSGVVLFNTSTGFTFGNSENVIDNCSIRGGVSTANNLIYVAGTTTPITAGNIRNSITNSNLFDWFNAASTTSGAAINIVTGASSWTISGNSFYQTDTRTFTLTSATDQGAIHVAGGSGYQILNNYFGGRAPLAGGSAWTYTGGTTGTPTIRMIRLNTAADTTNVISGNFIQNISVTTASTSTAHSLISVINGHTNITNNTIGSQSATGNITFISASTSTSPFFLPIGFGTGGTVSNYSITNNNIGGITLSRSGASGAVSFRVIYGQPPAGSNITISGNTIGGTVANSIQQNTGGSTAGNGSLFGVLILNPTIGNVITNNTIRNLTIGGTASAGPSLSGINVQSSGGHTITGNTIHSLTTNSTNVATNNAASIVGISMTASTVGATNVSSNTIYNLRNTNTTVAGWINGMTFSTATSPGTIASKNLVHSITLASATGGMSGIQSLSAGSLQVMNNMVRLGLDETGAPITTSLQINGIQKANTGMSVLNNTVYIGGSGVVSGTVNSFAFRRTSTGTSDSVFNNVFINARSNASGTGKHYAIGVNASTALVSDFNDLFVSGTGGVLGLNNTTDNASIAAWRTSTGQDASSISVDANFINATGATPDLHIDATVPTQLESGATPIAYVTDDFDGSARNATNPDLGADEFIGLSPAPAITSLSISPTGNLCVATARTVTAEVTTPSGTITGVVINYSYNGTAQAPVAMTNVSGNTWTGTIPAATPTNANVAWSVTATNSASLTKTQQGTAYQDDMLNGYNVVATATPASVCLGGSSALTTTVQGNARTITIGTGISVSTSFESPFNHSWGGLKDQFLIQASELIAAGFTSGQITSLALDVVTPGTTYNSFSISLASTSNVNMSGGLFAGPFTQVYSVASVTPTAGINTYTFSTPFTWDGVSNIVVQTCWSNNNAGGTSTTVRMNATPFVSLAYFRADNNTPAAICAGTPASATTSNRPKFILGIIPNVTMSSYVWTAGATTVGTGQSVSVTPTATTTYTMTATNAEGCTISTNVVVTSLPLPTAPTSTSSTQCGTGIPTASVASTTGAATPTFRWYDAATGGTLMQTGTSTTYLQPISTTTTFYVAEFDGACEGSRTAVTVTVTPPPALTTSPNTNICLGQSTTLTVSSSNDPNYTYTWTPGGSGASINVSPATTTTYTVTAVDASGGANNGCVTSATVVIGVSPYIPSAVSITPAGPVCLNGTTAQALTASGGSLSSTMILSENFNGTAAGWTTINNSFGATPADAAWTLRTSPYSYGSTTFSSNDNSQFILSNSDDQGSGGTTATILVSPVFNTIGFTSASVSFYHYFRQAGTANVEASTDGTTWTVLQSFTTTVGAPAGFVQATVPLTAAFLDKPVVYVRFKYDAVWEYYWAIDNVVISGSIPTSFVWTPNGTGSGLYSDAAATTTYTGAPAATVYALPTSNQTYTATASAGLGCSSTSTVVVGLNPTQFTVTGGGSYCATGTGVAVGLSSSQSGVNYQLQIGGVNTGSSVAGTGNAISFGNQTVAGTYTVVATDATTNCQETMTGSVTVSIDPLPTQYNVTGGGAYCATGSGVAVGLSNSQSGINYQLQIGGVNTGSPVAGTGSAISFGSQTTAGTYTVVATNATTNCQETMSGSATVTIDPLPTQFNVTGGGAYCATGVGTTVGLSGSEAGVDYQLVFNGTTNVGSPVGGTGSAISFGTQTTAGTYTVVATNATTNCQETMTGSATVSINPLPVITNLAVANLTQPTTCISNDGGASPIINGGAPGSYSFNWTGTGIIQGQQNQSALRVGAYSVTVTDGNGCQATATFSLIGPGGCDICPTISTVAADVFGVCQGGTATLTASGLADLGVSYGIAFVSSAVPLVNPYSGTVIATVSNGALTNSGTTAAAAATFNTPGNIYVYAILSPAPADPSCRPFTSTQIEVKATPDVNAVANQVLCAGSQTAAVNFSGSVPGTIYTWSNSNPAIGLAASGTGNISSFTATNFTNAPITATITVTPTNPVLGSRTFNFAGAAETWNVPAGVTSIRIKAWGAQGGDGNYGGYSGFPGKGGYAEGDLAVSPGELLSVLVGGAGQEASVANAAPGANSFFKFGGAGFNGGGYGTYHFSTGTTGGGGGASDVRALGTALSNRVIVAGGGGGSCCLNAGARAGDGGGLVGGNGFNNSSLALGIGGSQSAGGVWTYETQIAGTANIPAIDGILGKGGDAGGLREDNVDVIWSIGGGGGGYYGGSGGYPAGGGSSYIGGVTNALTTPGVRTGDGQVIIDYRIPASICPGPSKTFTITVNPIPTVNTVAPVAACNGASVSVPFSGFVPGTVYEWTNSNTAIGLAASGTGDLSFTGTNTGTAPITATIIVTPKYTNNGQTCTGTPIALTITINPTPTVNAVTNQTLCNNDATTAVTFSGSVTGTVYNWTNDNPSIGLAATGTGNIGSFTAVNTTNSPVTATITVTPSYSNGGTTCTGTATTFTITVTPSPRVNTVSNQTICNNASTAAVNFSTPTTGGTVTYTWTNSNTSIGLAASGTGDIPSFTGINTGTTPVTATVTVTPSYTIPGGATFTPVSIPSPVTHNVYDRSTTYTGVSVNGGGNAATVTPGSTVTLSYNYSVAFPVGGFCPGCIVQNHVGLGGTSQTLNCVNSITNGSNGSRSLSFTAPTTPGVYYIQHGTTLEFSCIPLTYTNNPAGGGAYGAGAAIASIVVPDVAVCTGTPTTFTITVNPTPTVNAVTSQVVCNGASTTATTFSGAVAGTTFSWTNSNTAIGLAASGTGNIPAFTATNTGTTPITSTITVTPRTPGLLQYTVYSTHGGNGNTSQYSAHANNAGDFNAMFNTANSLTTVHSSGTAAPGLLFNWNGWGQLNSNGVLIPNNGNFFGVDVTGTFVAAETGVYSFGIDGDDGVDLSINGTVVTSFYGSHGFGGYRYGNVSLVAGQSYSLRVRMQEFGGGEGLAVVWKRPSQSSYSIQPDEIPGCSGTSTSYTITVNPTPTVSAVSNQTICNGSPVTAVSFSGAVAGTVYNWSNNNTSIGLGASGTGTIPSFTGVNTTNAPITATITVTPSFTNGGVTCSGTPTTFTITVNPTPTVNVVSNQVVCNGANTTAVAFSGAVVGTVYSWTNDNASIGLAASGTGNIASFAAINTGVTPVTATITVTPSYTNNGVTCSGTPTTFTITVNPTPTVNTVANQVVCNGSSTTAVTFTGAVAGTVYTWVNNTPSIGLAANGTATVPSFTAVNTGVVPVVATITVTPTFTSGGITCTGTPRTFTITVNPTPTVNQPANQVVCNRSNTAAVAFTGAVAGTVYNWVNNTPSIGLAASGTGDIAAFAAVNTTQTPVVATITVTPSFTNGGVTCNGTPRTFTITVNPTPIVVATDLFNQRICISDGAIALNATPVGGSWSGIGVSGFNFIPGATAVGNYLLTYSYTNQFACTSTDTTTAKVLACDERNRSLAQGGAILYPNPNGGQFNIRVNSTRFQFLQMRIYNALGQLVSTKQWSGLVYNQVLPIDMRHLAAGVYTVRIIYDGGNLYEDRGYQMLITH